MNNNTTPAVKDLVLVGGGHAHVGVLRRLAMQPVPGLRITLIARDIHTPYSGMLPGLIAGHYSYDQTHIDLGPLCRLAGARLYHAEVEGIDVAQQQVLAAGRPPVAYDLLSINTGSRPGWADVPGAAEHVLAVKPIDLFLQHWEALRERILHSDGPFELATVGGGAGGVELLLSVQHRLQRELRERGGDPQRIHYSLYTADAEVLPTHAPGVRRRFQRVLQARGVQVHTGVRVGRVEADKLHLADGSTQVADAVLWVTSASTPQWPGACGLDVDEQGFIRVDECLRSTSHPQVFAAGDVASMPDPRPKSGVFAVRQGPVLHHNLVAAATGQKLKPYRPQKNFLGLISTGDANAVASRGGWSAEGPWLWKIKDWIDQRFMRMFNELPQMPAEQAPQVASGLADEAALRELAQVPMRCGGCGAKVGAGVLSRALQRLPVGKRDDVLLGREQADDAAMLQVPAGKLLVQSVDYFRAFLDDNFTFGRIAANHALGDLFAMGAEPQSALAIATVPYGREEKVEQDLYELLAGAQQELAQAGAVLAGGHSSEGAELAFGLSVNGLVDPDKALRKGGLTPGDVLILSKPLGTGTLMAADMRQRARGRWIDAAIEHMLQSNQAAATILQAHGARACTDITGFGLVGHLLEMLDASRCNARLQLSALPLLDGALDTLAMGITSSLQPANLRLRRAVEVEQAQLDQPAYPLLFDPQTAGGLLAGIPAAQAQACVSALQAAGYRAAAVLGEVQALDAQGPLIRVES